MLPLLPYRTTTVVLLLFAVMSAVATNGAEATDAVSARELSTSIEFSGEVARGDTVVHHFRQGEDVFEFRLVPFSGGWTIWIGDSAQQERNYVAVATGPFRGINPAVVDGWHFRNADNTGPNGPGEKNVNAPGMERGFAFVLDSAGYAVAMAAREVALANGTDKAAEEARRSLKEIPIGTGKLVIDALELGNLIPNQRAVIDRMAFSIRLKFPE